MIVDLEPPADRDLPTASSARIRATLLQRARVPRHRFRGRVLITAAALLVVVVAIAAVRPQQLPTTLALGPGQLSPTLEAVVAHCVDQRNDLAGSIPGAGIPAVATGDVALAAESKGQAMALFVNDRGYFACTLDQIVRPIIGVRIRAGSGATGSPWEGTRPWLPGPVQVLLSDASVMSGPAEMSLVGRVSSRVARLTAEDGTHTVTAQLANGMFGLLATTDEVAYEGNLVGYDAAGEVIYKKPLFPAPVLDRCWTDPTGKVLYPAGDQTGPAGKCLPAEPWNH
jgi:hypothetical protein